MNTGNVEKQCVWARKDRIGERVKQLEDQLFEALKRIDEMELYVLPKDVLEERRKKTEELRSEVLAPISVVSVTPAKQKKEIPKRGATVEDGEEEKTPSFIASIFAARKGR